MGEPKLTEAQTDPNAFPWKVDDSYPTRAHTPSGKTMHFDDLLTEGQKIGHGDGNDNIFPPYGIVVLRADGLWIEAMPDA